MNSILELCDGLPETAMETGAVLLAEGSRSGFLYVLIEGEVEIVKENFQVDTVTQPGAIFGEVSALLDVAHMATVRALSSVRVYKIANGASFLSDNPGLAIEVSRLLAQRLSGVTRYLVNLKHQFADQENHLGMVDEVLETLVHQQRSNFIPGSARDPDPSI